MKMTATFARDLLSVSTAAAILAGCALPQGSNVGPVIPASKSASFRTTSPEHSGGQTEYIYAANYEHNKIEAYRIGHNGSLAPVAGSPFDTGVNGRSPEWIAINPNGKFLYTANNLDNDNYGSISAYTIDPGTGALAPVSGSPFGTTAPLIAVAVDPSGNFLYAISGGSIFAFTVNLKSGALRPIVGSPYKGGGLSSITVNPNDSFVYVTEYGDVNSDGSIQAYSIDRATGGLTQAGSPVDVGGEDATGLATDARGQFVYTANYGRYSRHNGGEWGSISAFAVGAAGTNGSLTPVTGSPFRVQRAGMRPNALTITPNDKFAFVTSFCCESTILTYAINPSDGAPRYVRKSKERGGANSTAVDPLGKFLYIANYYATHLSAYTIDARSGALALVKNSPVAPPDVGMVYAEACLVTGGRCKPAR